MELFFFLGDFFGFELLNFDIGDLEIFFDRLGDFFVVLYLDYGEPKGPKKSLGN